MPARNQEEVLSLMSMKRHLVLAQLLWLGCVPTLVLGAGQPPASPALTWFQRPLWLTNLSLGITESWDSNVYLSGVDRSFLPPGFVRVPGSVLALKNLDSWVTTVSPKIGVNLVPLLGGSNVLQVLTCAYGPDFAIYHSEPTESYDAHRFATTAKGQAADCAFNLENNFTYIDGSTIAPTYPQALESAYGTGAPRERRQQTQDRFKFALQYQPQAWFVRPTASLLYYNLMTHLTNALGYQNYPDRTDVNGGVDLGYQATPELAPLLGYRYGHQYQEQFGFDLHSATSDYQRVLAGLEGKPRPWLSLALLGGPDFRNYAADVPGVHLSPIKDPHLITYYGEANMVAELSAADSLSFKYHAFQWESSVGRVPYFDSVYDLSYRHKFSGQLTLDLGGKLQTADYTSGNLGAASLRNDWMYSTSLGLTYAVTSLLSATVSFNVDLGRNAQDDIVEPQTREFTRYLVALGLLLKF